ncbi:molybdopterin-dependent oxidoreductase [Terrihabitans rhizophilus]|uniref:Oxidoreductase n=1 Tax=Terrihabitans rhizophilus TaxID=3092662 RepID=A0ABU4RI85_9HYPH|nr:molybdopterin-dependent oxidoreductase [Terrihabitans sp. PJ23]MDX6804544.1 oxidoreductase [Terrihabitans sp. PJ23]
MIYSLLILVCSLGVGSAASAEPLQKPAGTTILTISGKIGATNSPGVAEFDREMLEALGMTQIQTKTPWYDGVSTFEGVPIARLMELVQAQGTKVTAIALNDYVTEIPMNDFSEHGVILALKREGQYLSVRNHGPLFIIYPFDSNPDLQSQTYFGRSAWQLSRLVVK